MSGPALSNDRLWLFCGRRPRPRERFNLAPLVVRVFAANFRPFERVGAPRRFQTCSNAFLRSQKGDVGSRSIDRALLTELTWRRWRVHRASPVLGSPNASEPSFTLPSIGKLQASGHQSNPFFGGNALFTGHNQAPQSSCKIGCAAQDSQPKSGKNRLSIASLSVPHFDIAP